MRKYIKAEIEIVEIEEQDIITNSCTEIEQYETDPMPFNP